MAKPIQIARLVRIVRLLTTYKNGLSAQDIANLLADEGDEYAFSSRTIRRDFDDIYTAFGIEITFNTKEKIWAIEPNFVGRCLPQGKRYWDTAFGTSARKRLGNA